MRKEFLINHKLQYECCPNAEDLKLWVEIAKCGGRFYIENQPLLYHRILENQESKQNKLQTEQASETIFNEVLNYLIKQNKADYPELESTLMELRKMQQKKIIDDYRIILSFYQKIFARKKDKLILA